MRKELPNTWVLARLSEVGDFHCGQSPTTSTVNSIGIGVPYVSGPEQWDGARVHLTKWTSDARRVAPDGSIFITVKGAGVGTVFPGTRAAIGRDIYAFSPLGEISPRYLEHGLRWTIHEIVKKAVGDIPGLSKGQLSDHCLPLAPSSEQRRIVDVLDSYLTRLDVAEQALLRAQANLRRYRASVLKAAVEGRLVITEAELARQEGREYEPASVLLARILAERKLRWEKAELAKMKAKGIVPKDDRWKARYEEPVGPDLSGLPDLPEGWCWTTVEALFWNAGYGTSQKCSLEGQGPVVLRIPNIRNQRIDLADLKYATDAEQLSDEGEVGAGDFLFIRTNGSKELIGRGALVGADLREACHFASYLIRLRLVLVDASAEWFARAWHSEPVRSQLMRDAASSAGQHNVSLGSACSFVLPLPPMAEQARIVTELARLESVAEGAEANLLEAVAHIARLRQSILKWAFEGKLVDQDPNDEPAAELLARIRAEREKSGAQRSQSRRAGRQPRAEAERRARSSRSGA